MSGLLSNMSGIGRLTAAFLIAAAPQRATAQTEYYNLDFNRPLRVEDAVPAERRSLDLQLAPLRAETYLGGTRRWRLDPLLSYGIAPLTEIEVRVPVLVIRPSQKAAPTSIGLTNVGVGGMRALTTETSLVPATAVAGEVLLPAGSLAPPNASYGIKALLTKTLAVLRFNLNGSYGTYSVVPTAASSPTCRRAPPGVPGCDGRPTVPDIPCSRVPRETALRTAESFAAGYTGASYSAACMASSFAQSAAMGRSVGERWFAGAEVDHAFALSSTLLAADLFAEHLIGLSPLVDWTAEVGVRRQWSPQVVLDAGVARHFAGSTPSTAFIVGATYAVATGRRRA
jgi:hypothetical protein